MLDSSVSPNYATLFENEQDVALLSAPGLFVQTLVLNVNPPKDQMNKTREILTDVRVREAIALAVNQEELIGNVLNGSGSSVSAGLILNSMPDLYNPQADILAGDAGEKLARANKILDEIYPDRDAAGYRVTAGGTRLSFQISDPPGSRRSSVFCRMLLQKIGVEVKFSAKGSSPETTYLYGGNFDMTIQGVTFSLSNIDIMYNSHFSNLNRSSNYGRLQVPAITEQIDVMRKAINLKQKYRAVQDIQVLTAEQYYKIPLYCADVLSVARTDRFEGWTAGAGRPPSI